MMNPKVLQLLLLVSSITPQVIGMLPVEKAFKVEGIAQSIEGLPKELQYKIFSSALELLENQKYEVYRKLDVGSMVLGIALNADNARALTGSNNGIACIWNVESGKLLKELKGHKDNILLVALSADGTVALTGFLDRTAGIWNTGTGETIKIFQLDSFLSAVVLSADGSTALIGCSGGIGRLYNTTTGEILKELKGHTRDIVSVALSADGTIALTGSRDRTVRIWNMNTEEPIKIFGVNSYSPSVALNTDGTIALIASSNNVMVWDVKSGVLINTLLTPDSGHSQPVALSKDGKRALAGTEDGKIQVWNTKPLPGQKETRTPLTVLESQTGSIQALAVGSADFIASGSGDKTAFIWKPYALEPQEPRENKEVLWQAYKEIFSKPKFLFPNEK